MSATTVRPDTCPHQWCETPEPHDDEDGHFGIVKHEELDAVVDGAYLTLGLYPDFPGVNLSLEFAVSESHATPNYLRQIADALIKTADHIDETIAVPA